MYKLGKNSKKRLVGVHPTLAFVVMEAIKISEVDFGVTDGVRSMTKQRDLVKKGYSKTMNSYHLYGLAVDLVPYKNGAYHWDNLEEFKKIAEAMASVINLHGVRIDWGFELWGWDMPHWQMTGLRAKYDIRRIDPKRFT